MVKTIKVKKGSKTKTTKGKNLKALQVAASIEMQRANLLGLNRASQSPSNTAEMFRRRMGEQSGTMVPGAGGRSIVGQVQHATDLSQLGPAARRAAQRVTEDALAEEEKLKREGEEEKPEADEGGEAAEET